MSKVPSATPSVVKPVPFVCASCKVTENSALRVGAIAICNNCGASNYVNTDGSTRRATALDTEHLSEHDRAQLTRARSGIARAQ